MDNARHVARNTFLLTFGVLFARLLAVLLTRKMAPALGASGMGIWGTATDLTAILLIAANFGLGNLVTREIARDRSLGRDLLVSALSIRWALGALCYGLLVLFIILGGFGPLARTALLVSGLAIFIESTAMACDAVLQGHEKVQYQSFSQIVSAAVYFGLGWWWLDAGHGVLGVIWANVAGRTVRLALVACATVLCAGPWRRTATTTRLGWPKLLRLGLPLFLATTMGIVYNKVDTVMLNRIVDDAATGIYVLGHRALDFMIVVPNLFAVALFPAITRVGRDTAHDAARFGEEALRFIMLLTMPLTLLLCLVASPIIRFFADSPAFADSVVVLRIVIWGLPFQAAVLVLNRLLLTADRERRFVTIGLLAMLLNVGLNALLIPVASYHGAAAATVVTMAVAFLMHLRALSGSEFRPRLRRALLGPTLATLVAGTVTAGALGSLAPHGIIGPWVLTDGAGPGAYALALAIFVPSYLAAAVVIRVIDRDDARLLASMARIPGVVGRRRGDGG